MRKIVTLFVALLLTTLAFASKPLPARYSPYQYGHRWYFSLQGGPALLSTEHIDSYFKNGRGWEAISWQGALSFGYYFSDAWDLRISGSYTYSADACSPYKGFYPYHFHAAHLFADMMLNLTALAEYNTPFNPKLYLGVGGAYTFGATKVNHLYEVPDFPNLTPAFRLGSVFEFNARSGWGWFLDLGAEAFTDWYNGLEPDGFPLDLQFNVSFGLVYHFGNAKTVSKY